MNEFLVYAGRYWYSGLLLAGLLVAIWYVARHREQLMFNKPEPPVKQKGPPDS